MILRQANFVDRNNFPFFLVENGLMGEVVEVGVHRADFADLFLTNWKGKRYYCVDPWDSPNPGYMDQAGTLWDSEGRAGDFRFCTRRLRRYGPRVRFMKETSATALHRFNNDSLDFVYIDADHRTEMVLFDLRGWWAKLRSGGILAGHDFLSHGPDIDGSRVQPAVFQFAQERKLDVWMVVELLCLPWSFFFIKQ